MRFIHALRSTYSARRALVGTTLVVLAVSILGFSTLGWFTSSRAHAAGLPVRMGFDLGWDPASALPWNDINQADLFAVQTTNGTALDTSLLDAVNVTQWVGAAHAHGVQAMLVVGGISDQNWQNACVGANQAGFIQNLVAYMQTNGFDGIDLDIEDDVWSAIGPPDADMTACIKAISTAARAVQTQAGNIPRISEDITTPWMGPWAAPSVNYVDQFNLMTYGDTCLPSCASFANDIATTVGQGLPASKFVLGIDVIDAYPAAGDCGAITTYATQQNVGGVFVWAAQTDEAHNYGCFNQLGTGGSGPPPPPPTPTSTPSPTGTPPPSPPPTPTPPPAGCVQKVTYHSLTVSPGSVAPGSGVTMDVNLSTTCPDQYDFVEFNLFNSSGTQVASWDVDVNYTAVAQDVAYTWAVPANYPTGHDIVKATALDGNGNQLAGASPIAVALTIGSNGTQSVTTLRNVSCVITLGGASKSGKCSGTFFH